MKKVLFFGITLLAFSKMCAMRLLENDQELKNFVNVRNPLEKALWYNDYKYLEVQIEKRPEDLIAQKDRLHTILEKKIDNSASIRCVSHTIYKTSRKWLKATSPFLILFPLMKYSLFSDDPILAAIKYASAAVVGISSLVTITSFALYKRSNTHLKCKRSLRNKLESLGEQKTGSPIGVGLNSAL